MTSLAIRIAILGCLANEKRPWFCQGARLGGWDIIHVIREKSLFDVARRILSLRQRLECARLSAEYPRHVVRRDVKMWMYSRDALCLSHDEVLLRVRVKLQAKVRDLYIASEQNQLSAVGKRN